MLTNVNESEEECSTLIQESQELMSSSRKLEFLDHNNSAFQLDETPNDSTIKPITSKYLNLERNQTKKDQRFGKCTTFVERDVLIDEIRKAEIVPREIYSPESDEGNVEYKWRLVDVTEDRLDHLTTQMKFRLEEGHGWAFYRLGVLDDGTPRGLSVRQLGETLNNIHYMAKTLGATVEIKREIEGQEGKILEVIVSESSITHFHCIETRIVVMGEAGSGKSTLVGSLTSGVLDDGGGLSRIRVFRHRHEILDGRTSSVALQTIGYDANGRVLTISTRDLMDSPYTASEDLHLIQSSSRLVTLIDLAGNEKYRRSALRGLCGSFADAWIIVHRIKTTNDETQNDKKQLNETKQSLAMAKAAGCETIVIITGVDEASKEAIKTEKRKIKNLSTELQMNGYTKSILLTSSVSGEGLDELRQLLYDIPQFTEWRAKRHETPVFIVQEMFSDVDDIGLVLCGVILQGQIRQNDIMLCGPFDEGKPKRRMKNHRYAQSTTRPIFLPSKRRKSSEEITIRNSIEQVEILCKDKRSTLKDFGSSHVLTCRRLSLPSKYSICCNSIQPRYHHSTSCQHGQTDTFTIVSDDPSPIEESIRWKMLKVRSIQVHRIPVEIAFAGQSCSFAVEFLHDHNRCTKIRKSHQEWSLNEASLSTSHNRNGAVRIGMVLVKQLTTGLESTTRYLSAHVTLLPGSRSLEETLHHDGLKCDLRSHFLLFVQCVRQGVIITNIFNKQRVLKEDETGMIEMCFIHRPEFILPSMRCALWGDGVKGFGTILSIGLLSNAQDEILI